MILFWSKGRLGNQLFQTNAILQLRRTNERALIVGSRLAIGETIRAQGLRYLNFSPFLSKSRSTRLELTATRFSRHRLIGTIDISTDPPTRRHGLFPLFVCHDQFLQSAAHLNKTVHPAIRKVFAPAERQQARTMPTTTPTGRCFVHVRRDDYTKWPADGPAALPATWFHRQMDVMSKLHPKIVFEVYGDDAAYLKRHFAKYPRTYLPTVNDPSEVLKRMAACEAGILSPSTFSWWGAKLASQKKSGPFIAPEGWANWNCPTTEPIQVPAGSVFLTFVAPPA